LYPFSVFDASGIVGKVYPNPADDMVSIELNDHLETTLSAFDLSGRKVFEVSGVRSAYQMSVSDWSSGVYVLRVAQQNKLATVQLIVR
jgi:hypothetical protein